MLGRRTNKPGGGAAEQSNKIFASFNHAGHTETTMPPRLFAPPKLFLAISAAAEDEVAAPEHAAAVMSPTFMLQAGSPTSSPAACHMLLSGGQVPFSRGGASGGDDCRSRHRPWDARPVGVGLGLAGGALTGESTGAATAILTGQTLRPPHTINAPVAASKELGVERWLSPDEIEESEDYTCVIARGPNPGTVHIFDHHVGVDSGGEEFLRWCHGCSKDLGQGKDIFMYRGEMAFCSHECRYREMLFDEILFAD
ncbi:hypothetical protein QOZ80_2AG0124890 [Eleusine coracana subsp. coracana]|nr:hypothetical protein QOZ80_2AG0124890 [Eleusine coracana subsp. coracana]